MADIRKQSIKGVFWVYTGFAIGALITYLFTNDLWFKTEEYGLTRSLLEIGILVYAFSSIGTNFYLYKFFPYYKDNLENKDNDLLGQAIKIAAVGFTITVLMLVLLEPIVVRKFGTNAALLVEYFYLIIPIGFFYLMYSLLEAYSYGFSKGVTTNFLKETALRIFVLLIVILKILDVINLKTLVILFSLQFLVIAFLLAYILHKEGNLWITFKTSRVTKKFKKNIINIVALTFLTVIVNTLRGSIDSLVLAAKLDKGLSKVAVFGFVSYLAMPMQAPIRSMAAVTIPHLSRFWKEKNITEIARIYKRSSINLLAFSLFIFFFVLLNFTHVIHTFNINPEYLEGEIVFVIVGLVLIVELGTGLNGQIIGTSSFFRFELWTSILLTAMIIPLSYFLTIKYGLLGPAIANLVSFTIYNAIRIVFLQKKFNMQPFSSKTIEIILIASISFIIVHFALQNQEGIWFIILRSLLFSILFIVPTYLRNISPDVKQVLETLKNRFTKKTSIS
jgi:O-antigen/teichoic acid export membrane protein